MTMWQLWVDFHRVDRDGLTHAHVDDLAEGVTPSPGAYLIVGDDDADPAVAEVVSIESDGVILLRVLPGHADVHRSLLADQSA